MDDNQILIKIPEKVCSDSTVKEYDETSYRNLIATLSHLLHSPEFMEKKETASKKTEMTGLIRDYIHYKGFDKGCDEDYIAKVAECPMQSDLFSEFYCVPFPSPSKYQHTFIDLFAGIGGIRIPFDELGYHCVFSSEWDDKACKTYFANFGVIPYGDITKIPAEKIPSHDILLAGFPCQAFSIMGKMQGFADTRGTMFFEIERILQYHKPPYILLENVKQLVGHDKGRTFKIILERLEHLGYHVKWKILNALDFGLPQKRERVIIVGFQKVDDYNEFSFEVPYKEYDLSSVLEPNEDLDPN